MRDRLLAPIASAARTYSRVAVLDVLGAHQPVHAGPAGQPEDQHHGADAAPEHRREREDQQDVGDRR